MKKIQILKRTDGVKEDSEKMTVNKNNILTNVRKRFVNALFGKESMTK